MPYKDPEARRACHRRCDKKRRAKVLAYRKNQRAIYRAVHRYDDWGGELNFLIAQQAKDDRTYCIKYAHTFNEEHLQRLNTKKYGHIDLSDLYYAA
jgi:hypothetical protein